MTILKDIFKAYALYKETSVFGRYIPFSKIEPLLLKFNSKSIGISEGKKPIHKIVIGSGTTPILTWSQMHGNESTGTKAMFDVLNYLKISNDTISESIKNNCSITFIPILNPDGAELYTRENANKIDLNRDAVDLKALESKVLKRELENIQPKFCFNLHDQRTIFGVEGTKNSAVLSFLAPSTEETKILTKGRIETMNVISAINLELQNFIPNQIGRYTDEFYPTATGDNFQKNGFNTLLIESGHYPNDYQREITRSYTFLSIISGLYHIAITSSFNTIGSYFEIPSNVKSFYDVIHRHQNKKDEVYQYSEFIKDGKFILIPKKLNHIDGKNFFAHKEIVFVD